ncbi:Serine carboxypeptidase-like 35 [Cardamine amara subsp. amara]|uniref:Serine carboxypeptidase-like 35 n=1 Tax=Cardamine amara subsp. amara TaxID=228776 RepID=A0ABD0ZQ14_CARAN
MTKNSLWLLWVLLLLAIACDGKAERKEDDLVTGLPGQPPVNFRHYAGYVNLGPQQKQKALFYWFFEVQQNSSRRPLVLFGSTEDLVAHRLPLELRKN